MRRSLVIIILTMCALTALSQHSQLTEPVSDIPSFLPGADLDWHLVFNDEFNTDSTLNLKKWKVYGEKEPFARRDGYWTIDAAQLDGNGNLKMSTYEDTAGNYYDACIHTEGLFEIAYGYFEIRVDLHSSEGHWPAFWLYSGAIANLGRGGINGAEIDIFEKFKINRKVEHNIHWDGYEADHQAEGKKSRHRKIMKGYHTFGLWWSSEAYRFYVDGKEVWETDAGGICEVPLHILISDEVGTHRRMKPIEKAKLPDEWLVDHIRVYTLGETR